MKRKMCYITGALIAQQTELRNSSPEIGSNKVEERVKGLNPIIKCEYAKLTLGNGA